MNARNTAVDRMLAETSSIRVSKDELYEVAKEASKLKMNDRNIEGFAFTIARLFSGDPEKAGAVMYRMQALFRLLHEEGLPGWTLSRQPNRTLAAHEAVLAAAATEPLMERNGEIAFDYSAFVNRVAQLADELEDDFVTLVDIRE